MLQTLVCSNILGFKCVNGKIYKLCFCLAMTVRYCRKSYLCKLSGSLFLRYPMLCVCREVLIRCGSVQAGGASGRKNPDR